MSCQQISKNAHVVTPLLEGRQGKFCIAARHFGTGEEILHNPNELCATASAFKVPVLIELMRCYQEGQISLDTHYMLRAEDISPGSGLLRELSPGLTISIKDLATLMIIRSDNTATDILVNMLGADAITATMHRLGFSGTFVTMGCKGLIGHLAGIRANWPTPEQCRLVMKRRLDVGFDADALSLQGVPENDVTTPIDMVNMFHRMFDKTLLGPKGDEAALAILLRQQLNERIPGLLPKGTICAHKTGTLAGRVMNDAGIVWPKDGTPYAVAIFTDQIEPAGTSELLARLSRAVYDYYQGRA